MTPMQRQEWILSWMGESSNRSVSILDAQFVHAYIDATSTTTTFVSIGAPRCRVLSSDLNSLYGRRQLSRVSVGLGDSTRRFPKWVYAYKIRSTDSK